MPGFHLPKLAPDHVVQQRLATCHRCPLYVAVTGQCSPFSIGPAGRRGCGCFVGAKARLLGESCPNGQW